MAMAWPVELGIGIDYSTGDYGDSTDTSIVYVPLSLGYSLATWRFKTTIPLLVLSGPAVVSATDEPAMLGGAMEAPRGTDGADNDDTDVDSGLGDILVEATYGVGWLYARGWILDVTARVKAPTADEDRDLGTGKPDFTAQLDGAKTLGRWTPFAAAAYRFVGRSNDFDLQDTLIGRAGFDYRWKPEIGTGLSFEYREALSRDEPDPRELLAYAAVTLDERVTVLGYGVAGFSDGSPDAAFGTLVVMKLGRLTAPER